MVLSITWHCSHVRGTYEHASSVKQEKVQREGQEARTAGVIEVNCTRAIHSEFGMKHAMKITAEVRLSGVRKDAIILL